MSTRYWAVGVAVLLLLMMGQAFAGGGCNVCGQTVHKPTCPAVTASPCDVCGQRVHKTSCPVITVSACDVCGQRVHKTSCPVAEKPVCPDAKTMMPCPFNLSLAVPTGTGEVPGCGATVRGASDALFRAIKDEHCQIRKLLSQLSGRCPAPEAWGQLKALVLAHDRAEEAALFSILDCTAEGQSQAGLRVEQHTAIAAAMADLDCIPVTDCNWAPAFNAFKDCLLRHMWAEENKTFPVARDIVAQAAFCSVYSNYSAQRDSELASMGAAVGTSTTTTTTTAAPHHY